MSLGKAKTALAGRYSETELSWAPLTLPAFGQSHSSSARENWCTLSPIRAFTAMENARLLGELRQRAVMLAGCGGCAER